MSHSYDVIKLLSNVIMKYLFLFTMVQKYKNRLGKARVIVDNKVAPLFGHGVYLTSFDKLLLSDAELYAMMAVHQYSIR